MINMRHLSIYAVTDRFFFDLLILLYSPSLTLLPHMDMFGFLCIYFRQLIIISPLFSYNGFTCGLRIKMDIFKVV